VRPLLSHTICDRNLAIYRERALAAEALVRAKDEAIGELLDIIEVLARHDDFLEWM
jgi:hypothetical protein